MKFVCSHCKAKYQLADEKVAGRTLRMTCRSCGREILIRADPTLQRPSQLAPPQATAPPPPPPSAFAPPGTRGSLTTAPRAAPGPTATYAPPPAAGPLAGRGSLTTAPRVAPPPPPSPLGADFRAAGAHPLQAPATTVGPPDEWHVAIDDQPVGPIHRDEVARKIAAGALGPDSLAWREGLDDWMPIRDIPELIVLCRTAGPVAAAVLPPSTIGGRAGAAPGFAVEDWEPVPESSARHPAPGLRAAPSAPPPSGPTEAELAALRGPRMPSLPVLFALVGGLAFMMSIVAILGARYLAKDASAAVAPTPAPVAQPEAPAEPSTSKGTVIELDEQVLDAPVDDTRPRTSGNSRGSTAGTKPKKELTDAEKAMLARMGGEGADLSGLSTKSAPAAGPARGAGSLTAAELSSVVNRNKKQLQRCYETAARGAGSDDTVRLDVSITIAPSGGVSAVQLGGQGLPGMNECIERTVRTWRFPSAGEVSGTRFPLLFQPGA